MTVLEHSQVKFNWIDNDMYKNNTFWLASICLDLNALSPQRVSKVCGALISCKHCIYYTSKIKLKHDGVLYNVWLFQHNLCR